VTERLLESLPSSAVQGFGTATVHADIGGADAYFPGFIRITRVPT
jgi:hypothetical protein